MIKNYFKHSLGVTSPFSFKLVTLAGILCMAGIAKLTIQQEEKLKAQAAKIAEMEQKLDLLLNLKK